VSSSKEHLTSLDFRCSCSGHPTKMTVVEYRSRTSYAPETVVYVCPLCGNDTIVVHKRRLLLVNPAEQPAQY
jgi:hypothetical protein